MGKLVETTQALFHWEIGGYYEKTRPVGLRVPLVIEGIDYGRGVWGRMHTCICMAESLCCLLVTITFLIGCTPI